MIYLPLLDNKRPAGKGWAEPDYQGVDPVEGGWFGLRADGLVVVDCDTPEAWEAWEAAHERTYTVRTPRGRHYYYRVGISGITGPAVAVWPHTDIRAGRGSYVVAPGSPGYTVWDDVPLATFDSAWLPRKAAPAVDGTGWDVVPEGKRNATLAALAGTLRAKGMSAEAIARTVVAMNRTYCQPPLDQDECLAIAASIGRYEPESDTEIVLAGTPPAPATSGLWGHELDAYEARPVEWVVPDLIPEGLTILAGKPKIGKSWMSLGIAAEVARGGEYLDRPLQQGKALYLALEDTLGRLKRRLAKVLAGAPFPKDLRVETLWPKSPDGTKQIQAFMEKHPDTRLVIIDTLAKIRHEAGDRQKGTYQDDYTALQGLKQVADHYGIAIVVIHHLRKSAADDALDEVSGTTGLSGAADTILVLKQELMEGRGRDLEEDVAYDMVFDRESCRWQIVGDSDFSIVWSLPAWVLERTKPGDRVPSEKMLREVGLWSQDELQRQMKAMRNDPRFMASQPGSERSPLFVAPPAAAALDAG